MAVFSCSADSDSPSPGDMSALFGPSHVDHSIRQAIQVCWMALPKEKRSVDEVDRQIRRLVDRALRDLREDRESFGTAGA